MSSKLTAHEVKKRIKVSDLYELPIVSVLFEDHVSNDVTPMEIELYGRMLHYDKHTAVIIGWLPVADSESDVKNNWDVYCIVSSCIREIVTLTPGKKRRLKK